MGLELRCDAATGRCVFAEPVCQSREVSWHGQLAAKREEEVRETGQTDRQGPVEKGRKLFFQDQEVEEEKCRAPHWLHWIFSAS